MRLIDADELKKTLAKNITIWTFNISYDGILAETIDNVPTITDRSLEIAQKSIELGRKVGQLEGKLERPQGEWGKWIIAEIQCPNCFEYFETDCYSVGELTKCPNCGADMQKGGNNE